MKKLIILAVACLTLGFASTQKASAGVVVGASIGIPVYGGYSGYCGPRYYSGYYPYARPYYGYAYNYCPPAPVYYGYGVPAYRPYVAAPVVSFGFNFGGYGHGHYSHHSHGGHHGHGHHGRW
jgi:hypothetical protein